MKNKTILLVDDDPDDRDVFAAGFREIDPDTECMFASGPEQAMDTYREHPGDFEAASSS